MRVLIADGDVSLLQALQSYLWDQGHEVEVAVDGIECSAILDEFIPDVVVLERELLWGGYEGILSKMADDPLLSEIPVIQIGETVFDDGISALKDPPLAGCLAKPLRTGELNDQLISARHMDRTHSYSDEFEWIIPEEPDFLRLL